MIPADILSVTENRHEFFKKYAIVSKKNFYICSINMPYYTLTASDTINNYKTYRL